MSGSSTPDPDTTPLPPRSFGALLRRQRILAGMTQEVLAERAGLSTRAISALENGSNRSPQAGTLDLLAEALQLSAEERANFEAAARREKLHVQPGSPPGKSPTTPGEPEEPVHLLASGDLTPVPDDYLPPGEAAPSLVVQPPAPKPSVPLRKKIRQPSFIRTVILIGLVVLVTATGVLFSLHLLPPPVPKPPVPVRGGTWVDELQDDPTSFIPDAQGNLLDNAIINQALYLPLFYGDAQGQLHPGAALEIPTVKNGGINADATLWTFHLRPGLVWSDGQPYDARDVDYTWRVWSDPTFSQFMDPSEIIHSAEVSPDHLSITFHLTQPYAPFLSFWVDGEQAPLPWHHFNTMAPGQIQHSPDNLNPTVSSGPFLMQASQPSDHYTLVRNPRYYLASQGLPYLDQLVFRIGASDATILQDFQAGTLDSTYLHWDVIFRPINSSAAIGSSLRPRAM
ncbi:MAG TPA: ABC transporter substrate-binding protein [Ktedonobacterales bacterium]